MIYLPNSVCLVRHDASTSSHMHGVPWEGSQLGSGGAVRPAWQKHLIRLTKAVSEALLHACDEAAVGLCVWASEVGSMRGTWCIMGVSALVRKLCYCSLFRCARLTCYARCCAIVVWCDMLASRWL